MPARCAASCGRTPPGFSACRPTESLSMPPTRRIRVPSSSTAVNLRTEYLTDPLALDARVPRFSWEVVDDRRGASQSAYELRVASSRGRLEAGDADRWDSGVVASS